MPDNPFYQTKAWKKKRKHILQRDKYICKHCGGFADTVHHIQPLKDYPHLALEDDNLESVCRRCHAQEHPEKQQRKPEKPQPKGVRIIRI
jgi:5-methylcytosine-specific restriction protein A